MGPLLSLFLCLVPALADTDSWWTALYTATQSDSGNELLVYKAYANGTVMWVNSVSTSEYGGFTHVQNSLVVCGDNIFVTNPNSNSVSMFQINASNPVDVTYLDFDYTSNGKGPTAIDATSMWGGVVVTVTAYDGETWLNGFYFTSSHIYPEPSWARNLTMWTGIVDGNITKIGAVSQVSFSPNHDYLVIQFKGLPNIAVAVFTITSNGTLSDTPMVYPPSSPLGAASFGFQFFTDTWIVTTDAAVGLILYQIGPKGVVNASYGKPVAETGAKAYCWAAWDNFTNHIYGVAAGSMLVTEVSVSTSPWAISLVNSDTATSLKALTDAVAVPQMYNEKTKKWTDALFVLAPKDGIAQFSITAPGSAAYVGVTAFPSGYNLTYVAGLASYSMWSYMETSGAAFVRPSLLLAILLLPLMYIVN